MPRSQICFALTLLILAPYSSGAFAAFDYTAYFGAFDNLPNFSGLSPDDSGTNSTIDIALAGRDDNYAMVFSNTLTITHPATYEFSVNSDDGSRLRIDSTTVVDNDGLHAPVTVTGQMFLNAGSYDLEVEFFEKTGGAILDVTYRVSGGAYAPIPSNGELVGMLPGRADTGEWSSVINWPHIAISAANLPDGRVLTWSSTETNAFPSSSEYTHSAVFDPSDLTFQNTDSNFHDMFCAGLSSLESGVIVASGGNPNDTRTSMFDPDTLTWSPLSEMNDFRWYGTNITMPNNRIFSSFAKAAGNRSELFNPATNSWTRTANANMQTLVDEQSSINAASNPTGAFNLEWWAHLALTPQGTVFQGGPTPTFHIFDPVNGAANNVLGQMSGNRARMYGNSVTYDEGKVLLVGGADRRFSSPTSSDNVYLVDLNGPAPVISQGAAMTYPRTLSNSVTLPTGEVLVVGGNTVAKLFSDQGSVLAAEIYAPNTDSWRVVDAIEVPRNYHSTALLLKDARVLAAGGGACGNGCAANHLDGQIFSPPYLFDNTGALKARPTLTDVPAETRAGRSFDVTASASVQSFSLVRLSATTHHLNTDQRFLPVSHVDNGSGDFSLTMKSNPNVLIPGNYWLFAVDSSGTPSIGETIRVIRQGSTGGVDTDSDGVPDVDDAFPNDPSESADTDGDGVGDNADAFPNDPTETLDSDGDGIGDNSDPTPNGNEVMPLPYAPRNSTTILVENSIGRDRVWNVNPDNDSISVMSADGTLIQEIPVGDKPWSLAKHPNGRRVLVTNKVSATISVVDTRELEVIQTVSLPVGSQPHGIVFNSSGNQYFVVMEATGLVEKRRTSNHLLLGSLTLPGRPRHLSATSDDSRLLISNFITPPIPGESTSVINIAAASAQVYMVDPLTMTLASTMTLPHDSRPLSESAGPGMPNYLHAPVVTFGDGFAYLPSKKDNVDSGALRAKPGMTFEFTVRAAAARFDLDSENEEPAFRVDFDNSSVATGAAVTGDNRYLLTALETSRELSVYDTVNKFELMRLPTGRAPQGVALSSDGSIAYIHNFMDRSISRFDLTEMLEMDLPITNILGVTTVVGSEALDAQIFAGKRLFYDAQDDRLARDNYMSCASCHNDGGSDGRVWDLGAYGEGLRRTISLQGRGIGHGRLHWTANFDEVQDFEGQIRNLAGGTGLMTNADFASTSAPLGVPKLGRSPDLDALAAYVNSLTDFPVSPFRDASQELDADAKAGEVLFLLKGCRGCHSGIAFTDSDTLIMHDVGTIDADSGTRLGATLIGFDTPTILGVWRNPPYLHDGSAATLEEAINAHSTAPLTTDEVEKLGKFLKQHNPDEGLFAIPGC